MKTLFTIFGILTFEASYSQDTIYTYEVSTGNLTNQLMPSFDTSITSDYTNAFFGTNGFTLMPDSDTANPYPGTDFSIPQKAADFYQTFNFPFTAVSLVRYGFNITAAAIGPRTLLAFNYDVYNTSNNSWRNLWDSYPFYENGVMQFGHDTLHPYKYYVRNNVRTGWTFCVIETVENIGDEGGYFGVAFDTTQEVYDTTKFYNISYPLESNPNYPSVNGDTMFFKYGRSYTSTFNTYFNCNWGGNGEYSSPAFNKQFRIYGTRWDYGRFQRIKAEDFYFIKYVMDSLVNIENLTNGKINFSIYPNPSSETITLNYPSSPLAYTILICDALGREVMEELLLQNSIKQTIDISTFSSGVYFITLQNQHSRATNKLVKE